MLVCWAKVGKAEPIANPATASSKRVFIVSFGGFEWLCRLRTLLRKGFLLLQGTRTPLVKGRERHIEWMPRPIRRQYEIATFLDFWKRPSGFGESVLADVV